MAELDTLYCKAGKHEWEREKKRGKKPANCPKHTIQKAKVDAEERQRRLQEGRDRARAERLKDGVEAVTNWRENWLKPDAELWAQYRQGFITRDEWLAKRPEMIASPTKKQWSAAADAGILSSAPLPLLTTGDDDED